MYLHRLSIVLIFLLLPGVVSAASVTRIPAQAVISKVTVYQDRAQVTRSATINLKPGSQIISFEGLPVLLQDDSVRVEAGGTARSIIKGIEVKRSFLAQIPDKRVKEIDLELKQLERKLDSLDARKAGLVASKGFVDSIKVAWGDRISHQLAAGKPAMTELNEAMGFIGSNSVKIDEQQRNIEQEKKGINQQIDALKRKKQEATGSYRKESKTVEVAVETSREGRLTVDLSGLLGKATWEPVYDLRLLQDGTVAELTYRAQVRQQTGEDWNNVDLTLSTARPASGGAPPVISPWHISLRRPVPIIMPAAAPRAEARMFKKATKSMMPENIADSGMAEEAPMPAPAPFQTASAAGEGTSVAFRIPSQVVIPSDNTRHSTVIALEKLPVSTEYVTVPKFSQMAYLTAELINRADWPLLPGTVKIFSGNTFVGSAEMKLVASGEKFRLPFGSDDQIKVKREELRQHKEAGLFGSNRMGYRSTVTIANLRRQPQTIIVKDQLPIADNSEIKVSLEDNNSLPDEKKEDGTLIWKLKLAAGEEKVLRYEIVVEYPKSKEVTGL